MSTVPGGGATTVVVEREVVVGRVVVGAVVEGADVVGAVTVGVVVGVLSSEPPKSAGPATTASAKRAATAAAPTSATAQGSRSPATVRARSPIRVVSNPTPSSAVEYARWRSARSATAPNVIAISHPMTARRYYPGTERPITSPSCETSGEHPWCTSSTAACRSIWVLAAITIAAGQL